MRGRRRRILSNIHIDFKNCKRMTTTAGNPWHELMYPVHLRLFMDAVARVHTFEVETT
jgi:hypothetical protein